MLLAQHALHRMNATGSSWKTEGPKGPAALPPDRLEGPLKTCTWDIKLRCEFWEEHKPPHDNNWYVSYAS